MTIKCGNCHGEYEIIETGNDTDIVSECPNCGVKNIGNGEYQISETMDVKNTVKPLNIAAKIIRWVFGVILMIIMLDYILSIMESGLSDSPFLYYLFAFIAGISIIPPMRSKANPLINLIVFFSGMILCIITFYIKF
jgi:hypothetical protein